MITSKNLPLDIIVGCCVGGAVFLLLVVAFGVARQQRLHAESKYVLPLFAMKRREEEMAAAVSAQSELSAMLGHEIRTPANVLSGAALLLADTELSAEQQELLSVMQAGVKSMTQLISDMLALSRLDAGKFPLELAPVNVRRGIVDPALRMIELHQQQRGVAGVLRIDRVVDPFVPECCVADAARVLQILLNSLTNACKFTPSGGSVTIECSLSVFRPKRQTLDTGDAPPGPSGAFRRMSQTVTRKASEINVALADWRAGSGGAVVVGSGGNGGNGSGRRQKEEPERAHSVHGGDSRGVNLRGHSSSAARGSRDGRFPPSRSMDELATSAASRDNGGLPGLLARITRRLHAPSRPRAEFRASSTGSGGGGGAFTGDEYLVFRCE